NTALMTSGKSREIEEPLIKRGKCPNLGFNEQVLVLVAYDFYSASEAEQWYCALVFFAAELHRQIAIQSLPCRVNTIS
ncbi:hypothetical protein, partial [Acetobacter pasteurianus]